MLQLHHREKEKNMTKKTTKMKSKSQIRREEVLKEGKKGYSPTSQHKKVELLTFPQALDEVLEGKRVTRIAWNNIQEYVFLVDIWLSIHIGGKTSQLIVQVGDIQGKDWYVLPDLN